MKYDLYHDSNCPYSRKVLIMAHEHHLGEIFNYISPFTPEAQKRIVIDNPLAKMPALVISPGLAIFDSRVICRYVDTLRKNTQSFYPEDGMLLWRALRMEALGDGMVDAAIFARQELSRPSDKQILDRVDKQLAKVDQGLDCLEREVDGFGEQMTVGHVAAANALAYLDFRWSQREWRSQHSQLAKWYDRVGSRESFVEHGFIESDLLLKKLAASR